MSVDNASATALRLAIASRYSDNAAEKWERLLIDETMNWRVVAHQAKILGLGPLLYDTVARDSAISLPDDVRKGLKQQYLVTATQNALAVHELVTILRALAQSDIPTVLLKGAALILEVYDNVGLRPMVDLDILIQFEKQDKAYSSLATLGYVTSQPPPFDDQSGLFWNEVLLSKPAIASAQLELHWQLIDIPYYASRLTVDSLYSRSLPVVVEGVDACVLAPVDQILHLCIHNLYHHFGQISRTGIDIAYIINRYDDDINWERLLEIASDIDARMAVQKTLLEAADQWFAAIPQPVIAQLQSWRPRYRERFFVKSQESEYLKLFRTLITLPGIRLKCRFVRGQLFPSRNYLSWRYGISPTTPLPVAYFKRYLSGITHLVKELSGGKGVPEPS